METEEMSVEHVQRLADQAESLRMQSVAVPLKDLQILLRICETAIAQQNAAAAK
ncbi:MULTISPECIES: hypothetical protein [Caballeronia]|uniref:hypothetical protein n=1 Tax=Caballeronia TaxID=1827195 RepID=UPI0013633651|nr:MULTISPECIES: hypothetical protein [Caballeronia]MDR5789585.1 hypothetical protein [Caballeronia sp. LP003]